MANYHLHVQTISRGKGHNAVAASAYRSGEKLNDERNDKIHDYSNKQGVAHSEVMTPENAPEWMQDRQSLWNAVEAQEKRKDSQVAREVEFSLPRELSDEQNIALARDFIQDNFVDKGMVADWSMHQSEASDGEQNPHVHVMLTMRQIDDEGFSAAKATEWNKKPVLESWREGWEKHANAALEQHGHDTRIDHRTLEAQGMDREAQIHVGKAPAVAEQDDGYQERLERNEAIKERNRLAEMAGAAKDYLMEQWHKAREWVQERGKERTDAYQQHAQHDYQSQFLERQRSSQEQDKEMA